MRMKKENSMFAAARTTALLAGLAMAATALAPALADQPAPRIVAVGVGEVAIVPDMATVTLSILREAETAREALDAANEAAAAVIAALKEEGIADRDLRTSGLSVQPDYVYPEPQGRPQAPRIVGYRVTNTITARIRELANVGAVIDRAVTLGVNQGGDIVFGNDDPKPALQQARRLAVEDARARAEVLASAAGAGLGGLVEIVERNEAGEPPRPMERAYSMDAAAGAVPVEAGETVYRVEVRVTWGVSGGVAD